MGLHFPATIAGLQEVPVWKSIFSQPLVVKMACLRSHVWVGTETGVLKGINLVRKQATNCADVSSLNREQEINVMCWGDTQESEVLLGCKDGIVKVYSVEKSKFTEFHDFRGGEGSFCGLGVLNNAIITCVESGLLKVWREGASENLEVQVGAGVQKMYQCDAQRTKVGTGGKENDLKIWDLQRPEEPIFRAKNVRNDWLDLRVPIWIRDIGFIPETDKIVSCTSYHQVRIYDPNSSQRRPVFEVLYGEEPLTALSITSDGRSVLVGNSHGNIGVIDLRKGRLLHSLKGCAGSIRSIQCHKSMPLVASCGLDRFLRIHHISEKELLHKVYLKSRLNCLLLTSCDKWEEEGVTLVGDEVKEEDDEVWGAMETVVDKISSKRQLVTSEPNVRGSTTISASKKKKKKTSV